jgi:hypothetical protein
MVQMLYPDRVPVVNVSLMLFPGWGQSSTLVKTRRSQTVDADSDSLYEVCRVYCERIITVTKRDENSVRQSVIYPGRDVTILTDRRLAKNCRNSRWRMIVVNSECVENLGLITVQSYSWTLCRAWLCFSVTSSHKVHFDTGTVRVTLVLSLAHVVD